MTDKDNSQPAAQRRRSQGEADNDKCEEARRPGGRGRGVVVDTEDDPMVVIAALVEHAVAIAVGEWKPEHVRTVIAELVDQAPVERRPMKCSMKNDGR
jgi:hypothetical protein